MSPYTQKILTIAASYLGQQEVQPNRSFKDPAFLKKMQSVGWLPGQAWCSYFFKLVWLEAYADQPHIITKIKQHGTGGALNTLENYKADAQFGISMIPVLGAGIIFEDGSTYNGHAGIVTGILTSQSIHTIEGNTNTNGSRDGYEVALKIRMLDMPYNPNGLNINAFIHPPL